MSASIHPQAGKGLREEGARLGRAHPLLVHASQPTYADQLANITACNAQNETMSAPIDAAGRPDFVPLIKVSEAVGSVVKPGDTVIDKTTDHLAILFNKLGIDTLDVLETAGTKWNFLPFRPGLAGGHDEFRQLGGQGVRAFGKAAGSVVYDVKCLLPRNAVDGRL